LTDTIVYTIVTYTERLFYDIVPDELRTCSHLFQILDASNEAAEQVSHSEEERNSLSLTTAMFQVA